MEGKEVKVFNVHVLLSGRSLWGNPLVLKVRAKTSSCSPLSCYANQTNKWKSELLTDVAMTNTTNNINHNALWQSSCCTMSHTDTEHGVSLLVWHKCCRILCASSVRFVCPAWSRLAKLKRLQLMTWGAWETPYFSVIAATIEGARLLKISWGVFIKFLWGSHGFLLSFFSLRTFPFIFVMAKCEHLTLTSISPAANVL